MSTKIRLTKIGRKNAPAYRIVVAQTKSKRDGKSLDIIGHYNPSVKPAQLKIDETKFNEWVLKGAQVTEAVKDLREGTYKFKKYNPKGGSEEDTQAETTE